MFNIKKDGEFLLVTYVLNILVENLELIPVTKPVVTKINKIFQDERGCHEEPLTDADYKLLDNLFIAGGMDFNFVKYELCTECEYEQFKMVFESSKNKPDWVIKPYYTDYALDAKKRREELKRKHIKLLESAAKDGVIKIFSMQHLPLTEIEGDSIISREHAELYLKGLGLSLSDAPYSSTIVVGNHVPDDKEDETVQIRTGIYGERDLDAAAWVVKSGADVEKMTVTEIKMALKTRNPKLWSHGFNDWNRGQKVWPKKKPGKKSGN